MVRYDALDASGNAALHSFDQIERMCAQAHTGFHTLENSNCHQLFHSLLFLTLREPSVKRKDLQALTLVGPSQHNPDSDPLAVLHLDDQL